MDLIQAIILGLVQGVTEFLPVSSTAHIRVLPALFGWQDPGAAFTEYPGNGSAKDVVVYQGVPYVVGTDNAVWKGVGAAGWKRLNVVQPK